MDGNDVIQQSTVDQSNQNEANRYVARNILDVKSISYDHARDIYNCVCLFDVEKLEHAHSDNDNDIVRWQTYMCSLQEELFNIGCEHAERIIVDLCKENNVYLNSDRKKFPKSLSDITIAISQKKWYNNNKDENRAFLHKISYGIFRSAHNNWFEKLAADWLAKKILGWRMW